MKSFVYVDEQLRLAYTPDELVGLLVGREEGWHTVISPYSIERLIQEHWSGKRNHVSLISKFLTLHCSGFVLIDECDYY
jgi:hypothetical protein